MAADAATVLDGILLAAPPSGVAPDDGRGAWEALMRAVGHTSGGALRHGAQSDGMLAAWVRTWLLPPTVRSELL